jgi:O-antigen/teichoic acid export membrane protein
MNILTILSLAELGVGSAIMYGLYKPISENNYTKINGIITLFKKLYLFIALIIFLSGILFLPFLKFIVDDFIYQNINVPILFLFFLFNTISTYIYSFRKIIFLADQNEYLISSTQQLINILQIFFQIFILIITRNVYFYLLIQGFFIVFSNLFFDSLAKKKYPYLNVLNANLDSIEKKSLFNTIKSISFYKFGSVILTGTDNILISILIGTYAVGFVSNYQLIIASLTMILSRTFESIASSIGNLNISSNLKNSEKVFYDLFFLTFWIYSVSAIMFLILVNPFIDLWLGDFYLLDLMTIMSMAFVFLINGLNITSSIYRTSLGFFRQARFTPLFAAFINIILSIILFNLVGLSGIFIATAISRLITYGFVDPQNVFKLFFKKKTKFYFVKYLSYLLVFVLNYIVINYIINSIMFYFTFGSLVNFLIQSVIVFFLVNIVLLVEFYRFESFTNLNSRLKIILNSFWKFKK